MKDELLEALAETLRCDGIGRPGRAHEWRDGGWCAACGKLAEAMVEAALALLKEANE